MRTIIKALDWKSKAIGAGMVGYTIAMLPIGIPLGIIYLACATPNIIGYASILMIETGKEANTSHK